MKLATAGMALLVLLASTSADAWPWSGKKRLPRPLDSPIVRPKVRDDHKAGKRTGRHSARFERFEWGREKSALNIKRAHQNPSWLFQQ